MAVPNTLLLEKWAVADWDEWNSLPESIQNSAVSVSTQEIYIAPGGRVLPYISYIGICGAKGYGFWAFLVWNRV